MRRLAALLTLLLAGACDIADLNRDELLNPSGLTESDSDIARTFDRATLVLPSAPGLNPIVVTPSSRAFRTWHERQEGRADRPAILYLHGCTGLDDLEPLRAFARAGFVVIAPDSFARRYRPLQCRPSTQTGGANVFVYDFRQAELSYAIHRLRDADWFDHRRLFLVGSSEGGLAAALYRGTEFRARVIVQWTCQGAPLVRGISAPPTEPILSVVRERDPWYDPARAPTQQGDCGAFLDGRPRSQSIVLRAGNRHGVFRDAGVLEQVVGFLRREADLAGGTDTASQR